MIIKRLCCESIQARQLLFEPVLFRTLSIMNTHRVKIELDAWITYIQLMMIQVEDVARFNTIHTLHMLDTSIIMVNFQFSIFSFINYTN